MKLRKVAIVFNPVGGSAKKGTVDELVGVFRRVGIAATLFPTTAEPGSATSLARAALADGFDLIVAFGGDGTACQVAEALVGCDTPMAVFPGGTGNLFARSFYAVPTTEGFVAMLTTGEPQPVDMVQLSYDDLQGKSHNRLFMVALGLGKVSDAIGEASPVFKRLFGKLTYVVRVTAACLRPSARRFQFSARGDDVTEHAAAVFALNVAPPAMSMLSRGCNASDGYLDVAVFAGTNPFHLASIAACLAFGCPERSSHYRRMRTKEITISSQVPVTPNIDGDQGEPTKSVHLRVLPGAVKIVLSN